MSIKINPATKNNGNVPRGTLTLLENSDNDMALNLIAIKKFRLSDV